MKRLVYAFDSAPDARRAVDLLLRNGVTEDHLAVLAREDIPLGEIDRFREASLDVEPAMVRGIATGGVIGLVVGSLALLFPALGFAVSLTDVLWVMLGVGLIGAWTSALIGASIPNKVQRTFDREIAEGDVLLRADVPKENVDHISALLADAFPQHLLFQSNFSQLRPRY
jgi:hypothetical protein